MKHVLKAYQKESAVLDMVAFKSILARAPQNDKNFLEHLVGGKSSSPRIGHHRGELDQKAQATQHLLQ